MKEIVLNKSLKFINKYNDYSEEEQMKLKYGLEGIYLTITKLIIIFGLSIIWGMFSEVILLLILFNIIRYFGFGAHAGKSSECLIFSLISFIALPLLFLNIHLTSEVIILIGGLCIIVLVVFAPADTHKRPFPKTKKKLFRKIITVIIAFIYLIVSIIIKNETISCLLLCSIVIEAILVSPISYKILRQPFNNYKKVV